MLHNMTDGVSLFTLYCYYNRSAMGNMVQGVLNSGKDMLCLS